MLKMPLVNYRWHLCVLKYHFSSFHTKTYFMRTKSLISYCALNPAHNIKTFKKYSLILLMIFAILFLSWNFFKNSKAGSKDVSASFRSDNMNLTKEEMAFINENEEHHDNKVPAAEDVLVQKIPGDNNHLLMMAFYSRENYSEKFLTLWNGSEIVFRDNGEGFDKKAGDGLYTAKITADAIAFRTEAASMAEKMKKSNYKSFKYDHRVMIYDPDAAEGFDVQKFDSNEPVSVSGLTNALSTGLLNSSTINTEAATSTTLDSIRQNCIIITDLKVVEDSTRTWNYCAQKGNVNGPWTFGTLMRQLASKDPTHIASDTAVSDFIKNWLNNWAITQVINGDTVEARTLVNTIILDPWLTKSKNAGSPEGQLNMKFAPFRLLAIVNRFDLRDGALDGIPGSPCGEGRFIFCAIRTNCSNARRMTVIFEYGIHKPSTCDSQKAWAQQWMNLKNFTIGSKTYNRALQNITDQFSKCGTNPSNPNQSSLDVLRTNELSLSPSPHRWEFRQFNLDSATGNLREEALKQIPADKFNRQVANNDVKVMVDYINKNKTAIINQTNVVPLTWNGVPFSAGASRVLFSPVGEPPNVYHWDGTDSSNASTFITNNNARFFFSLNACSGCHAGETQTAFTHVNPVFFGIKATLSGFLTGKSGARGAIDFDNNTANDTMAVKDAALRPSANPKIRNFNEIKRRAEDLIQFTNTTCGSVLGISTELMFQSLNSPD